MDATAIMQDQTNDGIKTLTKFCFVLNASSFFLGPHIFIFTGSKLN